MKQKEKQNKTKQNNNDRKKIKIEKNLETIPWTWVEHITNMQIHLGMRIFHHIYSVYSALNRKHTEHIWIWFLFKRCIHSIPKLILVSYRFAFWLNPFSKNENQWHSSNSHQLDALSRGIYTQMSHQMNNELNTIACTGTIQPSTQFIIQYWYRFSMFWSWQ